MRLLKVCNCLTHMHGAVKEKLFMWDKKQISSFVFECQNCVCAAVREPAHQHIYYSEAQTQLVRCPTVLEEMKCNLMLNMEGVIFLFTASSFV